jgi:hypothetical protein
MSEVLWRQLPPSGRRSVEVERGIPNSPWRRTLTLSGVTHFATFVARYCISGRFTNTGPSVGEGAHGIEDQQQGQWRKTGEGFFQGVVGVGAHPAGLLRWRRRRLTLVDRR